MMSQLAVDFGIGSGICMEHADNLEFMANLETGSMKLIVTSPPYNIGKPYEDKRTLDE